MIVRLRKLLGLAGLSVLLTVLLGTVSCRAAGATNAPATAQTAQDIKPGSAQETAGPSSLAGVGVDSHLVVELDPATLWRPRGSEVRFTITGAGGGLTVQSVKVWFTWSQAAPGQPGTPTRYTGLVRSITNNDGKVEYGAIVPGLPEVPGNWPFRMRGTTNVDFTAFYTVPLADMHVDVDAQPTASGQSPNAINQKVVLQVGVTSVSWAVVVVLAGVSGAAAFLFVVVKRSQVRGTNPVLRVITGADGYASLSQFQIMLWTFVVGASAVYVIVLSGTLISITSGTLVLLGIAGGAAILGRIPPQSSTPAANPGGGARAGTVESNPLGAGQGKVGPPAWSDLIITNYAQGIDVTRIQMLIFTAVSAVFVALKVLVNYEIPVIPDGYLLLMGISNGVYLAGKRVPDPLSSGKTGSGGQQ